MRGKLGAQHTAKVSFLPEVSLLLYHPQQAQCPLQGKTWAAAGKGGHCILVTGHTRHFALVTGQTRHCVLVTWHTEHRIAYSFNYPVQGAGLAGKVNSNEIWEEKEENVNNQ